MRLTSTNHPVRLRFATARQAAGMTKERRIIYSARSRGLPFPLATLRSPGGAQRVAPG
ncbi:MAG: hypothetical protein LBB23_01655 [Rickettsiales bacterium]|nr:hypothetical protein [Rickettsiales bacterium]